MCWLRKVLFKGGGLGGGLFKDRVLLKKEEGDEEMGEEGGEQGERRGREG